MEFTFGTVERCLALTHGVRSDARPAFSARLKHFQRLRFPPGLNTGRGKAASYDVGHLLYLGVALELAQLGLTPERCRDVILSDEFAVTQCASMAARGLITDDGPEMFMYFDPASLSTLTGDREDPAISSFFYAGLGQLKENFDTWASHRIPRMAVFSMTTLIRELAGNMTELLKVDFDDVAKLIEDWAEARSNGDERDNGSDPEA